MYIFVCLNGCNVETIEVRSQSVGRSKVAGSRVSKNFAVVLGIKLATSWSREELRVLRVTYITITGWYLEWYLLSTDLETRGLAIAAICWFVADDMLFQSQCIHRQSTPPQLALHACYQGWLFNSPSSVQILQNDDHTSKHKICGTGMWTHNLQTHTF